MSTAAKEFETKWAIEQGAQEIDMVMNVGWAKAGAWDEVEAEIAGLARLCGDRATLKVILETCLLNDEEIIRACLAAKRAGAGFVKTSTGFGSAGATEDHIRLMRKMVGDEMGVKASGGIRTREKAEAMVKAGASRIGSSNTLAILGGT
jgi:deoxyribose-phosphate aldolase